MIVEVVSKAQKISCYFEMDDVAWIQYNHGNKYFYIYMRNNHNYIQVPPDSKIKTFEGDNEAEDIIPEELPKIWNKNRTVRRSGIDSGLLRG